MLGVEGNAKYWIFKEDIKYDDHTFHPYYAFGRHKKGVFTVGQPGKEIIWLYNGMMERMGATNYTTAMS